MIRIRDRSVLMLLPVIPSIVVLLALAYWGRYAEQVPTAFLLVVGCAVGLAAAVSWANVRFVTAAIRRIAQSAAEPMTTEHGVVASAETSVLEPAIAGAAIAAERNRRTGDALSQLEGFVSGLQLRARESTAETERVTLDAQRARIVQTQVMLSVARASRASLDDVRVPLHILLDNHFGELNDNQEELLGNAKIAADRMEEELRALQGIADLDAGTRTFRSDRVRPPDLMRSIEPQLQATADRQRITLRTMFAPDAPSCRCDSAEWRSALLIVIRAAIANSQKDAAIELELLRVDGRTCCVVRGAAGGRSTVQELYASRVIAADGGQVVWDGRELQITFPA
jgi:signal transduction histidine kinase